MYVCMYVSMNEYIYIYIYIYQNQVEDIQHVLFIFKDLDKVKKF